MASTRDRFIRRMNREQRETHSRQVEEAGGLDAFIEQERNRVLRPRYIESGGTRYPNFLGATRGQVDRADRETDTDVVARDEKRQGSAAGRAAKQASQSVNVNLPSPPGVPDVRLLLVGAAAFILLVVGVFGASQGAGRGATS